MKDSFDPNKEECIKYLLFLLDKEDPSYKARKILITNLKNEEYLKLFKSRLNINGEIPKEIIEEAKKYILEIDLKLRKEVHTMNMVTIQNIVNNLDTAKNIISKFKYPNGEENDSFLRCS